VHLARHSQRNGHDPSPARPAHRRVVRRSRLVVAAWGLAAAGLVTATSWLTGDLGTLEQRTAQGAVIRPSAAAPAPLPASGAREPAEEPRRPPLTGTENILIAGMDRRPGQKGARLTDTLIVVALQKRTGSVGLISIPRDMAVQVPEHGLDRINTVYGLAYARGENALSALKQAVSDLLALPIEHAMVVDLSVFEQSVDALGGITIDVPCPIIDDFVDPRTPTGRRLLDVPAGPVRMDGTTAAMYVRSRHGRSDFSRARRQQAVLSAVHRELLSLGNLGQIPGVWSTLERSVATDLKRYQLLDLGRRALGLRMEMVHGLVFSGVEAKPRWDQGRAMLFPDLAAIDRAVGRLFSQPAPSQLARNLTCPPADVALRRKHLDQPDAGSDAGGPAMAAAP
jgi:polyisoprenyl-teichoic acid--peptidoglycan teichoic acid transferase